MKSLEDSSNTVIGQGIIDFKAIASVAKQQDVYWSIVEQEDFEKAPLQSISESLQYLKNIL